MCGVVGVYSKSDVRLAMYEALILLQHRGQDAAGMMAYDAKVRRLFQYKGSGLVRNVFDNISENLRGMRGRFGIGHVRYPTSGVNSTSETQPFYVNSPCGVGLAHNGNLINAKELHKELTKEHRRHINTDSDSEILLNILAHELAHHDVPSLSDTERIFAAVKSLHQRCSGAYAVVALIVGYGLLVFRDPKGIRPLIMGTREGEDGPEYMFASESVAPDSLGYGELRNIAPGEAVLISPDGQLHSKVMRTANRATRVRVRIRLFCPPRFRCR